MPAILEIIAILSTLSIVPLLQPKRMRDDVNHSLVWMRDASALIKLTANSNENCRQVYRTWLRDKDYCLMLEVVLLFNQYKHVIQDKSNCETIIALFWGDPHGILISYIPIDSTTTSIWVFGNHPPSPKEIYKSIIAINLQIFEWHRTISQWYKSTTQRLTCL